MTIVGLSLGTPPIRPRQSSHTFWDGPPLPEPLPVPAELFYAVVESMDTEDVRTCALAARQFLPIARARNFETIRLDGYGSRCARLAQLIRAQPEIAGYVLTVVLDFDGLPGGHRLLLGNSAPDLNFILSSVSNVLRLGISNMVWHYVPHDQQKALLGLGQSSKELILGDMCSFDTMASLADFFAAFKSLDIIHLEATLVKITGQKVLPPGVVGSLMPTELYGRIEPGDAGALGYETSAFAWCLSWTAPSSLKLVQLDLSDLDGSECRKTVETRLSPGLASSLEKLALLLSCSILDRGACWLEATLQATTADLHGLSLSLPADDLLNQITQLLASNSLARLRHLQVAARADERLLSLQNVVTLRRLCLNRKLSTLLIVLSDSADPIQLHKELDDSPYGDITGQLPYLEARIGRCADRYIHLVLYYRILREYLFDLSDDTGPTCDASCSAGCACHRSGPLLTISEREANQVALEFVNCCCPDGPLRFAE